MPFNKFEKNTYHCQGEKNTKKKLAIFDNFGQIQFKKYFEWWGWLKFCDMNVAMGSSTTFFPSSHH
jgi:hypothetical protein